RRPGLRQRQGARRAVRAPPRRAAGRPRPVDLLRLRVRLRPDGGAGGLVLRHGRQPQQLPGQPLLGVRPQGQDQGQGVPDLLVRAQRSALAALVETRALHPVGPTDTRPTGRALGFYLHVPFCVQRCHYCSFNTAPLEAGQMDPYLRALHGELDLLGALDWARDVSLATVFLGGGTPSLLEPEARGAAAAFEAAREAGCDDVSVDLMYGLPGLAVDAWAADVERVLDWGPDHVSAYALTLDGGSPWGAGGVDGLPGEDEVVAQY